MISKTPVPSSLLTRPSLLARLRNWEDDTSWAEFYRLYRRLVYGMARRSGLDHAEAEDVVQDVFQHVADKISEFEARPSRGAFRRWLMNQTRWRIVDKFRDRPITRGRSARSDASDSHESTAPLPNVEEIASSDGGPFDSSWEDEWQRHLLDAALERVAQKVPAKQFQAFELHSRQGWSVRKIAAELGLNSASVYVQNHRLTKMLRLEVERLRHTLG